MSGQWEAQLFTALGRAAERCVGNFNAQELANTAWSFAKAIQLNAQLFRLLRGVAEQRVRDFNVEHVGMTL